MHGPIILLVRGRMDVAQHPTRVCAIGKQKTKSNTEYCMYHGPIIIGPWYVQYVVPNDLCMQCKFYNKKKQRVPLRIYISISIGSSVFVRDGVVYDLVLFDILFLHGCVVIFSLVVKHGFYGLCHSHVLSPLSCIRFWQSP